MIKLIWKLSKKKKQEWLYRKYKRYYEEKINLKKRILKESLHYKTCKIINNKYQRECLKIVIHIYILSNYLLSCHAIFPVSLIAIPFLVDTEYLLIFFRSIQQTIAELSTWSVLRSSLKYSMQLGRPAVTRKDINYLTATLLLLHFSVRLIVPILPLNRWRNHHNSPTMIELASIQVFIYMNVCSIITYTTLCTGCRDVKRPLFEPVLYGIKYITTFKR